MKTTTLGFKAAIDAVNPRLEIELPYLRGGNAAGSGIPEILDQVETNFGARVTDRRTKRTFNKETVSIRHVSVLAPGKSHYLIHVPKNCESQILIHVEDYKRRNLYGLIEPKLDTPKPELELLANVDLPEGISKLFVENRKLPNAPEGQSHFRGSRVFTVQLNYHVVYEIEHRRPSSNVISGPSRTFNNIQLDGPMPKGQIEFCRLSGGLLESRQDPIG